MKPEDYLKQPYSRCFIPVDDIIVAYIREFPGCLTEGKTIEETYERLEMVAVSWIEAALHLG
ncbi:MAG: type II toxin-antitoxin system HicB family antitoxin, partial [Deltaproteobacteria bacterium]